MSISDASPASPAQNPSINYSSDSSKPKFKCSFRSIVPNFSAKCSISKQKPSDIQKNNHPAATSDATTSKSDDRGGALSLSLVRDDVLRLQLAVADAKEYMDLQINQLHKKLEELERGSSDGDIAELRKSITKLKMKIPSQIRTHSAVSNPHRNRWPNINNAKDEMMHFFYREPTTGNTTDYDAILMEEFHDIPWQMLDVPQRMGDFTLQMRDCLNYFFKFPPMAIIKRRVMIYLWIGQGFTYCGPQANAQKREEEAVGNEIMNELIAKGFVEAVYQKCNLVPDSCRMSLSVRSSLSQKAELSGFTSNIALDLKIGIAETSRCLVNVGEAIIDGPPEIFDTMKNLQSVYLGRWQSSEEHHIEIADAKFLHALKKLIDVRFLSLQGISLITELPSFIPELNTKLEILDLRACHNLEMIPDNIGLLKNLTHLDMSNCYFLVHMPKSLAQLCSLQVLKGFFIGNYDSSKPSCTLDDLSKGLEYLRKLNIYTSMNNFPTSSDLDSFNNFRQLQKLTILWGGFSLQGKSDTCTKGIIISHQSTTRLRVDDQTGTFNSSEPVPTHLSGLQKLDLQGFPGESLPIWVGPANLKGLKKLYIRGGPLRDIGQFEEAERVEQWTVEILKLKYLSKLEMDWEKLPILFPKLSYLHKVDCPKLTNFPCDKRGVCMKKKAIDIDRSAAAPEAVHDFNWREIRF